MRRRDALPDPEVLRGLRELDAALAGEPTADPDLSQLVADVEAARPEPSAAFLAALDARVHAGFPREAQAAKAARTPWHVRLRAPQILAPGFAVVLIALLVGGIALRAAATASSTTRASSVVSVDRGDRAEGRKRRGRRQQRRRGRTAPQSEAASTTGSGAAASKSAPSLTPAAPSAPAAGADGVTARSSAPPTSRSPPSPTTSRRPPTASCARPRPRAATSSAPTSRPATAAARPPSRCGSRPRRLDDTLARLSKLAHVGALNQSASDITSAVVSAADQLADARAERAALLRALGKATTDRQIASLKARLANNRSEIAQRKGALDAQRRRADLATVSVTVQGTGEATKTDDGAWTPRDALHDAGRVLEIAGGVALIALAVLAPLAILAALALLAGRTLRRRRREGALDGAA